MNIIAGNGLGDIIKEDLILTSPSEVNITLDSDPDGYQTIIEVIHDYFAVFKYDK